MAKKVKSELVHDTIERKVYIRSFSGRMTKTRWNIIMRYCRKRSFSNYECGCSYDCCGHLCEQRLELSYKHNQVVIRATRLFNY